MALVEENLPGVSKGRLIIYTPLEAEKDLRVCVQYPLLYPYTCYYCSVVFILRSRIQNEAASAALTISSVNVTKERRPLV